MRCLLDTHIVIWAMVGSHKLSRQAQAMLEDPDNIFYVSSASVWETAIKHAIKPAEIPVTSEQMIRFCRNSGIIELPIRHAHSQRTATLPPYHSDPFDRMLIAQALEDGLKLMTHDGKLPPYGDVVLSV